MLLGIFTALCLHTAKESSVTFDEPEQVAVGYISLTQPNHDYSVINFRFSQILQALPLLAFDPPPRWPTKEEQKKNLGRNIGYGRLFLFSGGRDAQKLIFASRTVTVTLGVLLGGVIFWCSCRLHGVAAGLLSLAFYVFNPLVVAHASLATTEIPTTLFFMLSVLAVWRLLHHPTAGSAALTGLATGALATTKISGLLLVPITALLIGIYALDPRNRPVRWRRRSVALLGAVLIAWLTVWAVYGGPSAAPPTTPEPWPVHATMTKRAAPAIIALARDWRLLPDAYLFDLHQFGHFGKIRRSYLLGHYSLEGWWWYFPVAWLVKNPLPLLAAVPLALLGAWRLRRTTPAEGGPDWRRLAPFGALAVVYGGFALASNLNIGARHLLPLYPATLIFAGLATRALPRPRLAAAVAVALGAGTAIETATAHPHHLGYFNALAGGSNYGHRILVDSSTDWGESMIAIRHWLDRRKAAKATSGRAPGPVYLSIFANADHAYYGLGPDQLIHLPQFYDNRPIRPYTLTPGTYVISATMLARVYNGRFMGPWRPAYEELYQKRLQDMATLQPHLRSQTELDAFFAREDVSDWLSRINDFDYLRFSRLCAYLSRRGPDAHITPGVMVFEVTLHDLETALAGPPPELHSDGAIKGAARFADADLDFVK